MSATDCVTDIVGIKLPKLTYRESRVVTGLLAGKCDAQAFRDAGFGIHYQEHPNDFSAIQLIRSEVARLQEALVQHTLDLGLVTAEELHEQLTEELRGDMAELYDDQGELRPIQEWPLWARTGGVEIIDAPNMVPSADGGGNSWDQIGRKKTVRLVNRAKSRELAMKHRGVNAMVDQKGPDVHVHLHAEITQRLQGALARKQRLLDASAANATIEKNRKIT